MVSHLTGQAHTINWCLAATYTGYVHNSVASSGSFKAFHVRTFEGGRKKAEITMMISDAAARTFLAICPALDYRNLCPTLARVGGNQLALGLVHPGGDNISEE